MRKCLLLLLLFCVTGFVNAQSVMISASGDKLHRLNVNDCSTELVANLDLGAYDIAFHPDGTLYGIRTTGIIFEIDTISGDCTVLTNLNSDGMNALTIDINGLMYASSDEGVLYSYDVVSNTAINLGNIGYASAGDLTFYNGDLYMAAVGDDIVKVIIDDPSMSTIAINENVSGSIFGILTYAECGESDTYAVTYSPSALFAIDFENETLTLQCNIALNVWGGASIYEFLASSPLVVDELDVGDSDCAGQGGTIDVEASGGLGDISYSLDGIAFFENGSFTDLPTGLHNVTIIDSNGCLITQEAEVEGTTPVEITNLEISDVDCDANNSSLVIDAEGGDEDIMYSIDGVDFQLENIFNDVGNGDYTITVSAGDNCMDTDFISIDNAPPIIMATDVEDAICSGSMGSIEVDSEGGVGSVEYSIDGTTWQDSPVFNNVNPGNFEVFVSDENNCQDTELITVAAFLDPEITGSVVEAESCNLSDGSIEVESSGSPLIEFSINDSPFQSDNIFSGLQAGMYDIVIMDELGCIDASTIEILETNSPIINGITPTSTVCGEANGQISVDANGGVGDLQYSIDNVIFQSENIFENLDPGFYSCFIIDDSGCEVETDFEIAETPFPTIANVENNPSTCNLDNGSFVVEVVSGVGDISYFVNDVAYASINEFVDLTAGIYNVLITDVNGCEDETVVEIEVSAAPNILDVDVESTSCDLENGTALATSEGGNSVTYSVDGISYQSSPSFNNLPDGEFSLSIVDADGCVDQLPFAIADSYGPTVESVSAEASICGKPNGSLFIEANSLNGSVVYSIDGSNYQQESNFDELAGGIYITHILDDSGCEVLEPILVGYSSRPEIQNVLTDPSICDISKGSAAAIVEGGTGQLQYFMDDIGPQGSGSFFDIEPGAHTISVADQDGCESEMVFEIENFDCSFYIPNSFTPDGDGLNELFKVTVPDNFIGTVETFIISDRWGEIIYSEENIDPRDIRWDGSFNNNYHYQNLYSYYAVVEFYAGVKKEYRGTIMLLR